MDYDHSFGAVIDKGTLDALNCGEFKIVEDFVTCMEYHSISRIRFLNSTDALDEGSLILVSQISARWSNARVSLSCM